MEPCASSQREWLHVIQGTAVPASEPTPIALHVIASAIVPARVKQPVATPTCDFTRLWHISLFFDAGPAILVRFFSCFIVSHILFSAFGCSSARHLAARM